MLAALLLFAFFFVLKNIKKTEKNKFRTGKEYGSARWGNENDIKGLRGIKPWSDMILTSSESLALYSDPVEKNMIRNKNVLVLGGSGSGKSRSFAAPNILQMNSSYMITDPKCELLRNLGNPLMAAKYNIKFFNTIDLSLSMHYNPFFYIESEQDILTFVDTLIENTKGEGRAGDDFWIKAERLLYCALIGYMYYEIPIEQRNFCALLDFLDNMEASENDEDFISPVDVLFDDLKKKEPDHFAVRQYTKYKKAAGNIKYR